MRLAATMNDPSEAIPPGTFRGGEEVPAGTFHGGGVIKCSRCSRYIAVSRFRLHLRTCRN